MFLRFLVLIHASTAFPLQCPDPAQWSFRARSLCPNPSKYSCLKNDLINGYSENCTISDFQAPGRKGVLRGGLDADICSQERYHPWPIKYYTNVSTNCIFLKSVCNEEGQVVYSKGNRNTDITCRCDFTRGYVFLAKPRNPCYCVPSEEDCSCYLKTCIDQSYYLSPDNECIHEKMNTSTASCQTIKRERVSKERNDNYTEEISYTKNITPVQRVIYTELVVTTFCIGFCLMFCLYKHTGKCYKKEILSALMKTKLLQWKKANVCFIERRASKHVMYCIREKQCVSVVGSSGVGKTFLVRHVALGMKQIGYTIITVIDPNDIRVCYKLNRKTLFVVDDLCGNFTANAERLDKWKNLMKDITDILVNDSLYHQDNYFLFCHDDIDSMMVCYVPGNINQIYHVCFKN